MLLKNNTFSFSKIPGIFYGLCAVWLVLSIMVNGFFTVYNLQSLIKDCCLLVIISLGMSLCILSGRNNISVGAVMSLSGIVTGITLHSGANMFIAIAAGLATGALMGGICGFLTAYQGFDFWVVTYAFMGVSQGMALVLSEGNTVPGFSKSFRFLADGKIFGVYFMIIIAIAICAIVVYISNKTLFGFNIYSVGGSEQSALLSGIDVKKTVLYIYIVSGLLAGVSGVLLASKSNSASPIGGFGYEFDAIAAVLIGGITFEGGKGKVSGSIMGAMLMRSLRNGLNLYGLSPYWQTFIIGVVVMSIIVVDTLHTHRKKIQAARRVYRVAEQ